jgi:putative restriction endonuclease
VANGLLLRSDVHTLFDRGYITIIPDRTLRVSRHLRDDFDNGQYYLGMSGAEVWVPPRAEDRPEAELLNWHADTVFRG